MSESLKKIYMAYSDDEGCRFHRILSPARFVKYDLPAQFCASARRDEYGPDYDAYLIHGLPVAETIAQMAERQVEGKMFLWGVDDDFQSIPPWNPCKQPPEKLAVWDIARRCADHILVSTPHLARTFGDNARVTVAPNLLDLALYPTVQPTSPSEILTILWAGSNTHAMDVQPLEKAVRHILQKFRPHMSIEFVFFGQAPPSDLLTEYLHRGVEWVRPVELGLYWSVLTSIRPHIVLAPLYPCDFNLSKSNIRVLEGWALSAAVVASPVGEYRIVEHGVDGLWAHDADDWINNLEKLVTDWSLIRKLAIAGRSRIERQYDWNKPQARRPWAEAFARILDLPLEGVAA